MGDFAANVAAAMDRLHPAWASQPGVVAVSGGADSVALLRALHAANSPGGLVVAHLNHQLRGAESDDDESFVRELAGRLGKSFHVETCTVQALGGNLEATARAVRYEWLAKVAAETGAGWIATGHTADDQAETVLHRLIRGTGLTGLRGIAASRRQSPPPLAGGGFGGSGNKHGPHPVASQPPSPSETVLTEDGGRGSKDSRRDTPSVLHSPLPPSSVRTVSEGEGPGVRASSSGLQILRPLITLTRADVLAFLAALGQPFRTDSSNSDLQFTRNRIRAELLPLLRTFNPAIVDVLARLASQAEEVAEWVATDTRKLLLDAELPRAGDAIVLDAEKLSAAGEAKTRAALRAIWDRERWPVSAMTFAHWARAAAVALAAHPAADFPAGVHVRRAGKVVQLRRTA